MTFPDSFTPTRAPSNEALADVVLHNAIVYTSDQARSTANTIAIRGDSIVFVGDADDPDLAALTGSSTEVIDLQGRPVIPGITDAHTHPSLVLTQWHVALPAGEDLASQLEFLRDFAMRHSPAEVPFIYAEYYETTADWGPGGPSAAKIDVYVDDRPVLLQDSSDHASTVNSRMLEYLGVDDSTPLIVNPDDHAQLFVRASDDATPTGHLLEGAWMQFAEAMWERLDWRPPAVMTADLLHSFTQSLSACGVTAIFDAITSEDALVAAAQLDAEGRLNMYYHAATLFTALDDLPAGIIRLRELQRRFGSDRISVNTMKLFLDGTNEIGTSSVLEPFSLSGHHDDHGVLRVSSEDLVAAMKVLNDEGVDLHIHVVGDRGFRTALDSVELARGELGDDWRIQITLAHAELVDPYDMPRVAELGVYVNWTCHWSGGYFGVAASDWLGWERYLRMYQFNPIIEAGGVVTYGSDVVSDYEASRANPFFGMQVAHTRVDPTSPMEAGPAAVGDSGARQSLDARIALRDLLHGYTYNGALQLGIATYAGSLEDGKRANLAILSQDPMTVEPSKIAETTAIMVMFEGQIVHGELP